MPLARLFRVPVYYITGALLSVLALVALLPGLPVPSPEQYPSIVVVPGAGYLRLQISSGLAQGTLIM